MTGRAEDFERTIAFADIALGQMKALHQAATPRNYEIWYTYATGFHPALNQQVNAIIKAKGTISEADLAKIYENHLTPARLTERIDEVGSQVKGEIDQVMAMIDAAVGSASSYSESLAGATEQLDLSKDREGLRAIVESLVQTTKVMELSNQKLEERLLASKREINELQEDLEVVRTESLTDPLTQLANRKFFDSTLEKAIADAVETNEPLSLLMTDIDHFKTFNDNFGHLTGDQVLRLVGMSVKHNVKGKDTAARYGGEEFAIILPSYRAARGHHGCGTHPKRRDDQGTDEALYRRASRPHNDLGRRRHPAQGRQRAISRRTRRLMSLCRQTKWPQSRDVRN